MQSTMYRASDKDPLCESKSCSEELGLSQVTYSAEFWFLTKAVFYTHPHAQSSSQFVSAWEERALATQRRGQFGDGVSAPGLFHDFSE